MTAVPLALLWSVLLYPSSAFSQTPDTAAPAAAKLTGISVGADAVTLSVDGRLDYKAFTVGSPPRLVVELKGTELRASGKDQAGSGKPIVKVRAGQFQKTPPIARVVIELSAPTEHRVSEGGGGLVVSFAAAPPPAVAASTPVVVSTPVAVSTPAAPAVLISTPAVKVSTPPAVVPAVSTQTFAPAASTAVLAALPALPAEFDLPPLGDAFAPRKPVQVSGRLSLYLGQYYFGSSAGSLNGYGDAAVNVSKSYSPSLGVFGEARAVYTGFKQVNELAGGGTLFQQSLDTTASVKWIKRIEGGVSYKPRLGAKYELFRETEDEKWGKGLYDYYRAEAGLGWEKRSRLGPAPWTNNLAYDFYYTHYPNYKSLGSQFGTEVGAQDPGAEILDSFSHQFSYRGDLNLPGALNVWGVASLSFIEYPKQKVVDSAGKYQNYNRSDVNPILGLGVSKRFSDVQALGRVRPYAGVSLTFARLDSDQNHYDPDPARLKFIPHYYDYNEARVAPSASLVFLKPGVTFDLTYEFGYRKYGDRTTQNSDGSYAGETLWQKSQSVSLGLSWGVSDNLDFKLRGTYADSSSNTSYEQTYKYNYRSSNYFGGVEWRL